MKIYNAGGQMLSFRDFEILKLMMQLWDEDRLNDLEKKRDYKIIAFGVADREQEHNLCLIDAIGRAWELSMTENELYLTTDTIPFDDHKDGGDYDDD